MAVYQIENRSADRIAGYINLLSNQKMQEREQEHEKMLDSKLDPVRQAQRKYYLAAAKEARARADYYQNEKPKIDAYNTQLQQQQALVSNGQAMMNLGKTMMSVDPMTAIGLYIGGFGQTLFGLTGRKQNDLEMRAMGTAMTSAQQRQEISSIMENMQNLRSGDLETEGVDEDSINFSNAILYNIMNRATPDNPLPDAEVAFAHYIGSNPSVVKEFEDVEVSREKGVWPFGWGDDVTSLADALAANTHSFSEIVQDDTFYNAMMEIANRQGVKGRRLKAALIQARPDKAEKKKPGSSNNEQDESETDKPWTKAMRQGG